MIIESWVIGIVLVVFALICFMALAGWTHEGEKLRQAKAENKALWEENRYLSEQIARRNAIDNIKVANEYYKEK